LLFVLSFFSWIQVLEDNQIDGVTAWGLAFGKKGSWLLVLYLLVLLVTVFAAIAAEVIPRLALQLPPQVQQILPLRSGIIFGLAALGLVFLILQMLTGFEHETANKGGLPIFASRTFWFRVAVLLQVIAVVGAALEFWLLVRRNRPLPRVDISW
jgi:hypothetical protein